MLREIIVAGRRVRYADVGSGQPAVMLHAFPLTHAMWRPQLEAPPPGWRLIAPDLRGFGASDRVGPDAAPRAAGAQAMHDYADDVVGLLDELGLGQPVIAGVSMGGYVALAIHRRIGARLAGLVLADTRAEGDTDEARGNRRKMQALVMEKGPVAVADQMVPRLLGETTRRERPELEDEVRALVEANTAEAIHDALEALSGRPDSTGLLGDIRCPTLIVVGREDVLTPVPASAAMHARIHGSRLEVIDAAGHLATLERPELFSRVLTAFLDTIA